MQGLSLAQKKVFEIGFGEGRFLHWARGQGAEVAGCELINDLVDLGSKYGFDTRLGSPIETITEGPASYDLIVAFDVLEHMAYHQILELLSFVSKTLRPGGLFMARVPNGQSPFGRVWQEGDWTHVTTLSKGKFEQLSKVTDLQLVSCGNAYRAYEIGRWGYRARFRYLMRDLIERVISDVYQLGTMPLDPNIIVKLTPVKRSEYLRI